MIRPMACLSLAGVLIGGGVANAQVATTGASSRSLSVSAGASAWTGDFGAPWTTDIRAALLTARYSRGDTRFTASLPWMQIRSQGAVFTGIDGTPLLVAPGVATKIPSRREGVGDLTLGAAHLIPSIGGSWFDLDLYGKVKAPLSSSAKGVSTGKTDASLGAEVSAPLGRFVPGASISYRHFGDADRWRLNDGFAASVGATYLAPSGLAAVITYDYAEAASPLIDDSREVVVGLSKKLSIGPRLTGFAGAGLSRGAPDISGGLSLSIALYRVFRSADGSRPGGPTIRRGRGPRLRCPVRMLGERGSRCQL